MYQGGEVQWGAFCPKRALSAAERAHRCVCKSSCVNCRPRLAADAWLLKSRFAGAIPCSTFLDFSSVGFSLPGLRFLTHTFWAPELSGRCLNVAAVHAFGVTGQHACMHGFPSSHQLGHPGMITYSASTSY